MEEIREARRKEAEARQEQKQAKLVIAWPMYQCMKRANNRLGGDQGLSPQEAKTQERHFSIERGCWEHATEALEGQQKKGFLRLIHIYHIYIRLWSLRSLYWKSSHELFMMGYAAFYALDQILALS